MKYLRVSGEGVSAYNGRRVLKQHRLMALGVMANGDRNNLKNYRKCRQYGVK